MKAKFLLVVLTLAAAALATWFLLSEASSDARDPQDAGRTALPDTSEAPAKTVELEAAGAGDTASDAGAREAISTRLGAGGVETWVEGEELVLEVEVLLPDGTPAEESASVVATSSDPRREALFGEEGVFTALARGKPTTGVTDTVATAPVTPGTPARLELPPGTETVWLVVGGDYVYSLEPQEVSLANVAGPLTLRPALGAFVEGRATGPGRKAAPEIEVELGYSRNANLAIGGQRGVRVDREVRTGNDGHYAFRAVPTGNALALQTKEGPLARHFGEDFTPAPGEHLRFDLALVAGGTLTGRVVDEAGTPIEGAQVTPAGVPLFGVPTEELAEVRTGADGRFRATALTPGRVWVKVEDDVHQDNLGKPHDVADGQTVDVGDIVLDAGLAVRGRVHFADGSAAANAKLSLSPDLSANSSGSPVDPRRYLGADVTAEADSEGRFALVGLGEGPWVVQAVLDVEGTEGDRTPGKWAADATEIVAPSDGVEIVLEEPVVLTGRVTDSNGEPITAFALEGERAGSQWYMPPSDTIAREFESEDGTFVLDGLRGGTWDIAATAEGFAKSEPEKLNLPGDAEVNFVLERGIVLSGTVVDPEGEPVAGAEIAPEFADAQERIKAMQGRNAQPKTLSDDEGHFELVGLGPGTGSIAASRSGWAGSEAYGYELGEGGTVDDIVLTLRVGGTITGEVFDADGEPAKGCMVIVQMPTLAERRFTNADSNGRFEETHLLPGSYQVQAFPGIESFEPAEGGAVDQAALLKALKMTSVKLADGATEHVRLGEPPASPVRVTGRVTCDGEPIAGANMSFVPVDGGGLESLKIEQTDEDGRFTLVLDAPGDYRVTAQAGMDPMRQNTLEFLRTVPEGADHELNLELPLGRVHGRVLGPDGDPAQNARVTLSMQSGQTFGTVMGGQYTETRTDDDGRYEIRYLRAGTYTVAAGGTFLGGMLGDTAPLGRAMRTAKLAEGGSVGLDFELEAPGDLRGIVRDSAGEPVANASIFLRDEDGRLVELFSFYATNASGRFEYDGLAPGEYTITARTEDLVSSDSARVRIESGVTSETNVSMGEGTLLVVRLKDASGADVRSRVSVVDENGMEMNGMLSLDQLMELATNGADMSEQRVGPLTPGRYTVTATAADGRSVDKQVRLDGRAEKKLTLRLK